MLDSVLGRAPGVDLLCASATPARLAQLRERVGTAGSVVFFRGGVAAVLREFPLFWRRSILSLRPAGRSLPIRWRPVGCCIGIRRGRRRPLPTRPGLVERGAYAGFETDDAGVRLTAARGLPPQAGLTPLPGWSQLRIVLDALYLSEPAGASSASAAIRPFRQAWLRSADRALSAAWPYRAPPAQPLPPTLPDGRPWPRISIVTPSFNRADYIEETLLSVRRQDYPDIEHIVMDGGSTDGTMDIVERYRDGLAHIVSEPDRGQSHAINKGMGAGDRRHPALAQQRRHAGARRLGRGCARSRDIRCRSRCRHLPALSRRRVGGRAPHGVR
ncbi:MAG: glycosyltransferase [Aliidongia sp.]